MTNKKMLSLIVLSTCVKISGMQLSIYTPGSEPAAAGAAGAAAAADPSSPAPDWFDQLTPILPATQPYDADAGAAAADDDIIRNTFIIADKFTAHTEAAKTGHYAACSCQGRRTGYCTEDAHQALPVIDNAPITACFGVFDGHGGYLVSNYLSVNLFTKLLAELKTKQLQDAITDAFLETNKAILKNRSFNRQGSTGLVACIEGNRLHVANAGDSRAVLCSTMTDGQLVVTPLSRDHKPSDLEEKQRIESAGGYITTELDGQMRVSGILSVARAFGNGGNHYIKHITPNPEIRTHDLKAGGDFLILACDGLWDVLSNEDACAIVMKHQAKLADASCELVTLALSLGSSDNITVMVIDLRKYRA